MSTYKRTEKQNDKNLRGQAELVMAAIEAHPEGATLEQLTSSVVEAGLVTRQDPSRIVSYYLSIFRKQGLVLTVKPVATAVAVADPVNSDIEDDEPEGEDDEETEDETEDEDEHVNA